MGRTQAASNSIDRGESCDQFVFVGVDLAFSDCILEQEFTDEHHNVQIKRDVSRGKPAAKRLRCPVMLPSGTEHCALATETAGRT